VWWFGLWQLKELLFAAAVVVYGGVLLRLHLVLIQSLFDLFDHYQDLSLGQCLIGHLDQTDQYLIGYYRFGFVGLQKNCFD
jgi:hypothetical protein